MIHGDDEDDDSIDINLRSRVEIGHRLIILSAVLARVGLESNAPLGGDPADIADAEAERFDLLTWLKDVGAIAALSRTEGTLLRTAVPKLLFELVAESSWQAERLAIIAWGAGLVDQLKPMHEEADVSAALGLIPTPWDGVADFIAGLQPRSDEEVAGELERSEIWLWRAETEEARRIADRGELVEIAQAIADVVAEGVEMGLFERAPDGDFLANGKSFHRLSEEQRTKIAIIASERLRALNWLRGAGDDWDDLSTDL